MSLVALGTLLAGCGTEVAGGGGGYAEDAGAPAAVSPGPTPAEIAVPSTECPASGARVAPGVIDAAMGLRAGTITLTNCGTEPYTVEGHPELALVGDDGVETLDIAVQHDTAEITASLNGFDEPPRLVTLEPGEAAWATIAWRNTTDLSGPPVDARFVDVIPAPGEEAQRIMPDGGIDLGTTGRLAVSPWTAFDRG